MLEEGTAPEEGADVGEPTQTAAAGFGAEGTETTGQDIAPDPTPDEGVSMDGVPEWARSLKVDQDILKDPSLKAINDVDSLAKSYVHAQRKIGQKGVIMPNENSTKEEWDTFYQKAGVPLEEQDYRSKLEFPSQEEGSSFDDHFNEDFARKAHELRIRPDQATDMYKFFNEQAQNKVKSFQENLESTRQEELNKIMNEMGEEAYNVQLSKAGKLIKEEVGEDFYEYLTNSGLGTDPKIVKAFMKLSQKMYNEEPLPMGKGSGAMTKDQIQNEINLAMGNYDDPYHKPDHPDHKRRVDEIQKLFAKLDK